jgi:tRNA (guanine10-N2)-dimethyltransferase
LSIKKGEEVWQTIWIHDFEHWIKKDRHMPYANAKAGILPPKIARSMVNLVPLEPEGKSLVDPFCGSGRVLVEAAELGYSVGGADILKEQVSETRSNLDSLGFAAQLEVLDATHLSDQFRQIDAIVNEPFLGKPNLRRINRIGPGLKSSI